MTIFQCPKYLFLYFLVNVVNIYHNFQLRKLGDDEVDGPLAVEGATNNAVNKRNWVVTSNPEGVVREVKEKRVLSREETEEVKETEDIQHYGDITDEVSFSQIWTIIFTQMELWYTGLI